MTADADLDGASVVLICDGTTWNTQGVKVHYDAADCDSGKGGTIRYSSGGSPQWEFCDGGAETWRPFESSQSSGVCAAPTLCPNVGDICDDGNPGTTDDPIFAGFVINPTLGGECRALFVAPEHQANYVQWSVAAGVDHIANDSVFDGRINDAQIPDSTNFPAAKACKDLVSGGFDDWYLPAREELLALSYHRDAIAASSEPWDWNIVSSTEENNDRIWMFHLHASSDQPYYGYHDKVANAYGVRCIRTESAAVVPSCSDDASGQCLLQAARDDGDPEFLATNIANGVNILGVTGTMTGSAECPPAGDAVYGGSGTVGVWSDGTYVYGNTNGALVAQTFNGTSWSGNLASTPLSGDGWNLWGDGTYIYVADGAAGLKAYTFNGTAFTLHGTYDSPGYAQTAWGDGTYIYLADGNAIRALSFDGTTFTLRGTFTTAADSTYDVWADGGYIYTTRLDTRTLYALTFNGTTFTTAASTETEGSVPITVFGDGTHIYVGHSWDGIEVYTFNGTAFTLDSHDDVRDAHDIVVTDGYMYAALRGLGAYRAGATPFMVSSYPNADGPAQVAFDSTYVYEADEYGGTIAIRKCGN